MHSVAFCYVSLQQSTIYVPSTQMGNYKSFFVASYETSELLWYSVLSIKRTGSLNYFEVFFTALNTLNLPCLFNNFSKFYQPDNLIDPVG